MKIAVFLLVSLSLLFSFGCSPKNNNYQSLNEKVGLVHIVLSFPNKEVKIPDNSYCLVNPKFITDEYSAWRDDLFKKGIVKWDNKFDCNKFAMSFASFLQERNMVYNYQRDFAESIAVGEIWYRPANSEVGHAINVFLTRFGVMYFEPQTGKFLTLSNEEYISIKLIKF